MQKFNLNLTGEEVLALLNKIKNGEVLTSAEKNKIATIENTYVTNTKLDTKLAQLKQEIATNGGGSSLPLYEITLAVRATFVNEGFIRTNGTIGAGSSYAYTDFIDVTECTTIMMKANQKASSLTLVTWYDADQKLIGHQQDVSPYSFKDFSFNVPEEAVFARFGACVSLETEYPVVKAMSTNKDGGIDATVNDGLKSDRVYISANGDDENDGLKSDKPIATLEKAKKILKTTGELIFLAGDYYNFKPDFGLFSKTTFEKGARLIYYDNIFNSAQLIAGSSKIYSTPCTESFTKSLWQHDIADSTTEISRAERHPLHRDKTHRLPSTRISLCDASDLTSALAEMEANESYLYYTDGTNLYFTAPSNDFVNHPIINGTKTIYKSTPNSHVHLRGVSIWYAQFKTIGLSGRIEEAFVIGGYASGCLIWDSCTNLDLVRCETCGADNDGINGHGTGHVTCYDCWTHDNLDDGESCHDDCYLTMYGGLCEYNDSGCTPASGGEAEYHNVLTRKIRATGFSAQGVDAVIICNGCCALDCGTGFNVSGNAIGTLINCSTNSNVTADGATKINLIQEN